MGWCLFLCCCLVLGAVSVALDTLCQSETYKGVTGMLRNEDFKVLGSKWRQNQDLAELEENKLHLLVVGSRRRKLLGSFREGGRSLTPTYSRCMTSTFQYSGKLLDPL